MTRWAFLVALPWVVVSSTVSLRYEPHEQRYEVRESTITIYDHVVGNYGTKGIAEDVAKSLNMAHERRNPKARKCEQEPNGCFPRMIVTEGTTYYSIHFDIKYGLVEDINPTGCAAKDEPLRQVPCK